MGSLSICLFQGDVPQGAAGHVLQGPQRRRDSSGSQTANQDARKGSEDGTIHFTNPHSGCQVYDWRKRSVCRAGRTDETTQVAL